MGSGIRLNPHSCLTSFTCYIFWSSYSIFLNLPVVFCFVFFFPKIYDVDDNYVLWAIMKIEYKTWRHLDRH